MSEMNGPDPAPGLATPAANLRPELLALRKLRGALPAAGSPEPQTPLRAKIMEIGRSAEAVQLAAGVVCRAVDALEQMERALAFALDSALEARSARSLPEAAVEQLQGQVDLAINTVDRVASEASFGGRRLFVGRPVGGVTLPRLSAAAIGMRKVSDVLAPTPGDCSTRPADYSQSVASAGSGGPNSLANWAAGAAMVLSGGAREVATLRRQLVDFYNNSVVRSVKDIAVSISNAIAATSQPHDVEEAMRLVEEAHGAFNEDAPGPDVLSGEGLLRLLD